MPPLSTYALCRTADLDVFRDRLCSMFYPARVDTLRRNARLEGSWLSGVRLTHLTIGAVRFGTETTVEPGPLGSYHVNLALAGQGRVGVRRAARRHVADARRGVHARPRTTLPRWSEATVQLCIKIRRRSLEAELTALLGHPVSPRVDFALALDLTTAAAQSWLATLRLLMTKPSIGPAARCGRRPSTSSTSSGSWSAGSCWLSSTRSPRSSRSPQKPVRPPTVDRVIALIHDHADRPLTLTDLATHAGVGGRRLQQGFRDHVGMSPMEYLRRVRLDRARRDLTETQDTITEIAFRWGFTHPGRFARAYREQFGVAPSKVRAEGVEPSCPREHRLLRPACLPFHHARVPDQSRSVARGHTMSGPGPGSPTGRGDRLKPDSVRVRIPPRALMAVPRIRLAASPSPTSARRPTRSSSTTAPTRRCCARRARRGCACSSRRTARCSRACTRSPRPTSSTSARSSTRPAGCPAQAFAPQRIVLGQEAVQFARAGIGRLADWTPLEAPARRRRWYSDGDGTLAVLLASGVGPRRPRPDARRLPARVEQAAPAAARRGRACEGRAPAACADALGGAESDWERLLEALGGELGSSRAVARRARSTCASGCSAAARSATRG